MQAYLYGDSDGQGDGGIGCGSRDAGMRSSDDQRQAWLEFLRSDRRAMDAWCQQQAYEAVRTNAELTAYVAEIDVLLEMPCR